MVEMLHWEAAQIFAQSGALGKLYPGKNPANQANSFQNLSCDSQRAWERLKPAKILHDTVPYPPTRDGIPMHSKVLMFYSLCICFT
jgi:hypothetical protein